MGRGRRPRARRRRPAARPWPARRRSSPGRGPAGRPAATTRSAAGWHRTDTTPRHSRARPRRSRPGRRASRSSPRWRTPRPGRTAGRSTGSAAVAAVPPRRVEGGRVGDDPQAGERLKRGHDDPPGRRTGVGVTVAVRPSISTVSTNGETFCQPSMTTVPRTGDAQLPVTWPTMSPFDQIGEPSTGAGAVHREPISRRWSGQLGRPLQRGPADEPRLVHPGRPVHPEAARRASRVRCPSRR